MYNRELPLRFKAVTPFASGNDDNKIHGLTITADLTVVEKEVFADLTYGDKGSKYIDALLSGDVPVSNGVKLRFFDRDDLTLFFKDNNLRVECILQEVKVLPLQTDHWPVVLKLKLPEISEKDAKIVNMLRTLVYVHIETKQTDLPLENIEWSPMPEVPKTTPKPEGDPSQTALQLGSQESETEEKGTLPVAKKKKGGAAKVNRGKVKRMRRGKK